MTPSNPYLAQSRRLNGAAPAWLQKMRAHGIARFVELGFPSTRLEEWRYTNVAPIAAAAFRYPGDSYQGSPPADALRRLRLGPGAQLVFVNGRYAAELSLPQRASSSARLGDLAAALASGPEVVERHLGQLASYDRHSFVALNTGFLQDGAYIHLPRGTRLREPIHVLFVSAGRGDQIASHPRVLVVAEEDSRAAVVETYVGLGPSTYLTNAVTEIALGTNAQLTHYKLQRETMQAFHVGTVAVRQAAGSHFASGAISLGGRLVRTEINTTFAGNGAECTLDGLYLASGEQHVDHHTSIDHRLPHCSSRQLYKGILSGRATAVFNGRVLVRPQAQKSDARQVNNNLLLSRTAAVNTKPQLEILADDVKCSHGATIGRLPQDALFYLRARGIGESAARNLLLFGFANEMIQRLHHAPVKEYLEHALPARLREL